MNLKTYWEHLVTKEKALFKSATMWLAAVFVSAPDILGYMQASWPSVAPYLPRLLQDKGMRWVALAVFAARMKSMIKLPVQPK